MKRKIQRATNFVCKNSAGYMYQEMRENNSAVYVYVSSQV